MKWRRVFGWPAATVLLAACQLPPLSYRPQSAPPPAPVRVPGGVMVAAPLTVPDDIEAGERIPARLDSLVEKALANLGFRVVPASEYGAIWDSLTLAAGGFFDPFTGQRREAAFDSAVTALFAELNRRHNPVTYAYPALVVTEAELTDGFALWDGHREYFDLRIANGAAVLGLSLVLNIEDRQGESVFESAAGLRVIERYSWIQGQLEIITELEELLTDEHLDRAAAQVVKPVVRADTTVTDSLPRG